MAEFRMLRGVKHMAEPMRFDPASHTVGVSRELRAALVPARPDPAVPVDGLTIGVATMAVNSPHGGEMHPDGDEVLYLISGAVNVVFEDEQLADIGLQPGDGLVVPRGVWHRVDIIAPSQILYATPGPRSEYRPLAAP